MIAIDVIVAKKSIFINRLSFWKIGGIFYAKKVSILCHRRID